MKRKFFQMLLQLMIVGLSSFITKGQSIKDFYVPSQSNFNKASFYIPDKNGERSSFITKIQIEELIKNKDISREYEFYNKKPSQVITSILEKLNLSFIDRKKIKNIDYRNVIIGYKIDYNQEQDYEQDLL